MKHTKRLSSLAVAAALGVTSSGLAAQQHAHGGAAFGSVHFATSCNATVAAKFDLGVAQLHSFEFGESIKSFNEVLAADPTCAMSHWGIALSRWSNPMAAGAKSPEVLRRGRASADSAAQLASRVTERERGYIAAVGKLYEHFETTDQRSRQVAYERAMGELAQKQPADTEATIFYALALSASALPTDKSYANQIKAGGILEPIWLRQPNHPGIAHYIIHSYDYPALADKAQKAAQRYAEIAPAAAHALHMPSHTFTRVGLWKASVETNNKSKSVALASGAISEALHASDYAMYAYLQLGKLAEAKALLDSLPALAKVFDPNAVSGAAPGVAGVFALASIPARWALERRNWSDASKLTANSSAFPYTEAMTYFARALGSAHTKDLAGAKIAADSLTAIEQRLRAKNEMYWAEQVAIQQLAAQAFIDLAEQRTDEAVKRMREAATREDATEKNAITPGPLAPARELLGDMLVELKRPDEALVEYKAVLKKEPNRRHTVSSISRLAPSRTP